MNYDPHTPISGGFYIAPGKALWRAQCLCGWLGKTNRTENAANNRVKAEHIRPLAQQNQETK